MADVGMKASQSGEDVRTASDRSLHMSSKFYMHAIGQDGWRSGAIASESHIFPYIPIILAYTEDVNNSDSYVRAVFGSGTKISTFKLDSSVDHHRFYLLFQPVNE